MVVGTLVIAGVSYLVVSSQTDPRDALLALARADIGKDLRAEVWAEVNPALSSRPWCGAWVLSKLRAMGLTEAEWKNGIGFVGPLGLRPTKTPKPGDIAYKDQPKQHYALVETPAGKDGPLITLDGNASGGVVRRVQHINTSGIIYYPIDSLL